MPVWQKAHNLAVNVYHLTIHLLRSEDYGLTSQIRRSANSAPANISEGFGRKTSKDKSNFYVMASGSSFETQNHLIYGKSIGYFEKEQTEHLLEEYNQLIYEINKLINSLS